MAADHSRRTQLGHYELRGILGQGAMGVVYDAWDPGSGRRVAVKTIRLPESGDNAAQDGYRRFKREAQAAGLLNHPGIVGVYGSGEADGIAYIAMELVDGQSLQTLMDAEHRLTPSDAVRLMKELLDALAYSHACGVIHRDIKPSNIMLTPQGHLKIADFGIARIESSNMTQVGLVMGTPAYMSPEQFMGQTVDQRTDIYAAGVLLFQLLTGERPFEGGPTAIMHKVLHTVPPRPSELSVTALEALDPVVAKAMSLRPEDRYPSAQAFSAALTAALAGGPALPVDWGDDDSDATMVAPLQRRPTAPAEVKPQAPPPAIAPKKPQRHLPLISIGIASMLVVLGAGSYWLLRPGAQQQEPQPTIITPPPLPSNAPPAVEQTPVTASPAPVAETPSAPPPTPAPATTTAPDPITTAPPAPSMPAVSAPPLPQVAESPAPQPAPPPPMTAVDPVPPPALAPQSGAQVEQAALVNVACTLLDVTTGKDNRTVVTGLVGNGSPEHAARAALATAGVRASTMKWAATRFDGPYCRVVDTLRTIRSSSDPGFDLGLRGGRMRLRNGEIMAPTITAPSVPAYLQLAYFQSNQIVAHLFPPAGQQDEKLAPRKAVQVGGPSMGGWPVGDPFGADMMVAIMSSAPLPARPLEETSDAYLAALERSAQKITRDGGTISVRAVPIQTYK